MSLELGRAECGEWAIAHQREWLVTNGIGGFAAGTVAGALSRRYHGLLIAALTPPLGRTLLVSKFDETLQYAGQTYPLFTNHWRDRTIDPHGYRQIERFRLEGGVPVWQFACGDVLLEKRIWMAQGQNTTYIRYTLTRSLGPVHLSLKPLVNYRDFHRDTHSDDWEMAIAAEEQGVKITAFEGATPFWLLADVEYLTTVQKPQWQIKPLWYQDFHLSQEAYRGLTDYEDHLYVGTLDVTLNLGESLTIVATTDPAAELDGTLALEAQVQREQAVLQQWRDQTPTAPPWIEQLALAADQFVVDRTIPDSQRPIAGKSIIAGYPWFGDWGRDTMISLPGLTLTTGRPAIARQILQTFAQYLDQGMLPNVFPDGQTQPQYNTVDAILWYFEAARSYVAATQDDELVAELFPKLAAVIDWHIRGTRYNIQVDPQDGLLYAGEPGSQLTWMDAKVDDWVVTPRIGKPVEINALWYNALLTMAHFAQRLGKPASTYEQLAQRVVTGFSRFWNYDQGYAFDVLDGPQGHEASLRPNQIFAVSLPTVWSETGGLPLLLPREQRSIVDAVGQWLLTSHGLRSLSPEHEDYQGQYGGDRWRRDGAYHQGTVWGWLIGHFVQAHLQVYRNPQLTATFLAPMAQQLEAGCIGTLGEIFDGDAPFAPRGAFAQAWTVAEVLRAWRLVEQAQQPITA